MRLEHHLVGGYVRYISPHIIIIIIRSEHTSCNQPVLFRTIYYSKENFYHGVTANSQIEPAIAEDIHKIQYTNFHIGCLLGEWISLCGSCSQVKTKILKTCFWKSAPLKLQGTWLPLDQDEIHIRDQHKNYKLKNDIILCPSLI